MAEFVCGIQMPKHAMVSLLSDSTCPTLKVGERAHCISLSLNQLPYFQSTRCVPSTYFAASTDMPHAHSDIEMLDPITIADVREIAQKRLDPAAWDYYITGADDEQTVVRNETIFKK